MNISLRAARVDVGLSQQDMADELGVSRKTVQSWEKGGTIPRWDKVEDICKLLGRSYNEIRWRN